MNRPVPALLSSMTLLAACTSPTTPEIISLEGVAQASRVADVHPAVTRLNDRLGPQADLYALDVACPDPNALPECAADAAVRVAAWLAPRRGQHTAMIVNVNGSAFQLKGGLSADDAEAALTTDQALSRFRWNGGSYEGKSAAARWCSASDPSSTFCSALAEEACNTMAPPDVLAFCEAR